MTDVQPGELDLVLEDTRLPCHVVWLWIGGVLRVRARPTSGPLIVNRRKELSTRMCLQKLAYRHVLVVQVRYSAWTRGLKTRWKG
jgi:hypothetical protein